MRPQGTTAQRSHCSALELHGAGTSRPNDQRCNRNRRVVVVITTSHTWPRGGRPTPTSAGGFVRLAPQADRLKSTNNLGKNRILQWLKAI
eukprot:9213856-Pyramimonas_sp.AAC.1